MIKTETETKNILNFLLETEKLKKIKRAVWAGSGIKNPETVAEHSFRMSIMSWVLAREAKEGLNFRKIIKISLAHDLPWVFVKKKSGKKLAEDKKAFRQSLRLLPPHLRKDIYESYLEYENSDSKEGKFVKQVDKIETFLQTLEYLGAKPNVAVEVLKKDVRGSISSPHLLNFFSEIEKRFFENEKKTGDLDFFLEIGKLKKRIRESWTAKNIKIESAVADDSFMLAMATWVFAPKRLNLEEMFKIGLIYEICEAYIGEKSFLEKVFPGLFSKGDKEKLFKKDWRKKEAHVKKICRNCSPSFTNKIVDLWGKCKGRKTAEGNFINQLYWAMTMLELLERWKNDKKIFLRSWAKQMTYYIDNAIVLGFLNAMYEKYLNGKKQIF